MNHDIDGKLDRAELEALRDYMDKQLKKLKKLAVSITMNFPSSPPSGSTLAVPLILCFVYTHQFIPSFSCSSKVVQIFFHFID